MNGCRSTFVNTRAAQFFVVVSTVYGVSAVKRVSYSCDGSECSVHSECGVHSLWSAIACSEDSVSIVMAVSTCSAWMQYPQLADSSLQTLHSLPSLYYTLDLFATNTPYTVHTDMHSRSLHSINTPYTVDTAFTAVVADMHSISLHYTYTPYTASTDMHSIDIFTTNTPCGNCIHCGHY